MIKTQIKMRELDGDLKKIKDKYKDNKQKQAQETMALYKERGVNPFSGFLLILIQIPIIFALYKIFLNNGFPAVDQKLLYSFVPVPENVSVLLFGFLDITKKSFILAFFAGLTQFFQTKLSIPAMKPGKQNESLQENFVRNLNLQMRYIFPFVAFFISWSISGAVALYWTTSNLFAIGQELIVRQRLLKQEDSANKKDLKPEK
jgi:YidC/Oxa1 family membrane protein insertase